MQLMKKLVALLAVAVALSSIGVMAIQNVLAAPTDPYNPYAPGIWPISDIIH